MKKCLLSIFALFIFHFAQAQQAYNITFTHEGKTVYGTFETPNGNGPFPTIIINPGSGANDRHGTLPMVGANAACLYPNLLNTSLRPYRDLATDLVAAGYAVLRYDKIEYTYTTPQSLGPVTFKKIWLPVESAIDYVKTRPDVDASQIILIGHSEGSTLIPYIAKKRNDVKALVSIAGPRSPLDSLMAYQNVHFTQLCNGNVAAAQAASHDILNYFSTIRNNTWNASTPAAFGVPASVWADYIPMADSVALNYNEANLPTLFTGLQLDLNVPIAQLSRFQKETNIGADFYQIPALNHYMTTNNQPQVSKVLTDTIVYWLNQKVVMGLEKEKQHENSVTVFPNPVTAETSIQFGPTPIQNLTLSLKTLTGKLIQEEKYVAIEAGSVIKIKTENLPTGIYLLHINADNKLLTRKIIKQN